MVKLEFMRRLARDETGRDSIYLNRDYSVQHRPPTKSSRDKISLRSLSTMCVCVEVRTECCILPLKLALRRFIFLLEESLKDP